MLYVPDRSPSASEGPVTDGRVSGPFPNEDALRNECYHEGQPAQCASEQEVEDLVIAGAQLEADTEVAQNEHDALATEIEDYCSQYPWDCADGESGSEYPSPFGGPRACGQVGRCAAAARDSLLGLAASAATLIGYKGARVEAAALGTTLSAYTVVYWYIGIGAAAVATGIFGYEFFNCWWNQPKIQSPVPQSEPWIGEHEWLLGEIFSY